MWAIIATAVAGGLVFLLTRWFLARRDRVVQGRAAARLVNNEIEHAAAFIEASVAKGVWMDEPAAIITTRCWEDHKAALAAAPGFKGWTTASEAERSLDDVRRRAIDAKLKLGSPITQGNLPKDWLLFILVGCELATEGLEAYAKTPVYKSERVKDLQELLNTIMDEMADREFEPIPPKASRSAKRKGNRKRRKK